jgi:acyl transferase domain-containing protein
MRSDRPDPAELLTAYADGIAELEPDERHRIADAIDGAPGLRDEQAAITGMLARLRDLPAEGDEPDWAAMERSIRAAVGDEVPRPWWRRWQWLAPATTLVTAMAVLLVVVWTRELPEVPATVVPPAPVKSAPVPVAASDDIVPLWLDGGEVDVDAAQVAAANLLGEAASDDEAAATADDSLLPANDLALVDGLDADGLARAEHWLAAAEPRAAKPEVR